MALNATDVANLLKWRTSKMNGEIDIYGDLYIIRGGERKEASCPYHRIDSNGDRAQCGDHCALFGEPVWYMKRDQCGNRTDIREGGATLKLCKIELRFDEFNDERIKKEESQ
jgi:hypothetical protein